MHVIRVETARKTQLVDVTAEVRAAAAGKEGSVVTVFCPHTTAGVVLQAAGEGATKVAADIEAAFEQLVDERRKWEHTSEGDRNPWSHVRAALTASSVTIPLIEGELGLSALQAVFLCEFDGPRARELHVVVH
jgi:secondary thiamine-phosphate synthase enzyme